MESFPYQNATTKSKDDNSEPPVQLRSPTPNAFIEGKHDERAPQHRGEYSRIQEGKNIHSVTSFLTFLRVLPDPARAVEGWMDLLRRRPVTGADVFDLQLVATMLANGVSRIYTFNDADFVAFSELAVTIP